MPAFNFPTPNQKKRKRYSDDADATANAEKEAHTILTHIHKMIRISNIK